MMDIFTLKRVVFENNEEQPAGVTVALLYFHLPLRGENTKQKSSLSSQSKALEIQ